MNVDEIAAREAAALGLTQPQCAAYLRDHLHFYLGPREWRGIELFREKAARLGVLPVGEPSTPFADSGRATQAMAATVH